jgi:IclR family acetate operon transcriptional repressor
VEQEFQRGTQTIDRAAQLLTLVLEADEPRALSDLAGDAELPKSTASRLLSALERQGLVEQHGRRGSFEPGPVLRRYANRGQIVELAQPHLEQLSALSGETINLAVPGPLGVEHLAQIESRHFLGTGDWVGRRVPYDCTAVGKVLIAFGGADPGPLEDNEIARVREQGYATAIDELEIGLAGLAAPVIGAGGRAIAALSISGPTLRLGAEQIEDLYPQLINQARALGHDMGANAA